MILDEHDDVVLQWEDLIYWAVMEIEYEYNKEEEREK